MKINHQDLFATRLWVTELSHLTQYYDKWRSEIKELQKSNMTPRGNSNRIGWNSQPILFTLPSFKPLIDDCINTFNYTIKTVSPERDYKYVVEAWANVNELGGFNTLHHHPGALMSGVFYLTVPPGSGHLVLRDPRPGALLSTFPAGNAPNAPSSPSIAPREGLLVIFPNWLEHRVEPHQGAIPRVSIAMNAIQITAI